MYASASVALDPADNRYHIYVGPYSLDQASQVQAEFERLGMQGVRVVPDR